MNTMEVSKLKSRSKEETAETMREYHSWSREARFFSNWVLLITAILSAGALAYHYRDRHIGWGAAFLLVLFIASFAVLIMRKGHTSGYLCGYNDGFDAGIDKALGIDEAAKQKLTDIKTDISDLY